MVDRLGPYELGPGGECEGIYTGDARELAKLIPDESVDLIFTDPVYQNIGDYRWLAETAVRVLKATGSCLVWVATPLLKNILEATCPPLNYQWILHLQKYGPCYPGKPGICVITQCLWLDRGGSKTYRKIADWFGGKNRADGLPEIRNKHGWSKPQNVVAKWLNAFTLQHMIVVDPFTGGGTVPAVCKMLGRRYLAFEIDPDVAETARERVRMTQMPLPGLIVDQAEMTLGGA